MPAKKSQISDAERAKRAKRIRKLAQEAETDNDPKSFERAFAKVVHRPQERPSQPRDGKKDGRQ
jgi:hypothetical protein